MSAFARSSGGDQDRDSETDRSGSKTDDRGSGSNTVERVDDHETRQWTGAGVVALALFGFGAIFRVSALALAAVVPLAYVGFAAFAMPPRLRDTDSDGALLTVDRGFDEPSPDPGDDVVVSVTVRNESDALLTDVRIVDGVPPGLAITDGTARHGDVVRPGDQTTFSYAVTARRGEFTWRPAEIALADPSGSVEREVRVDATTVLRCSLPPLDEPRRQLPLRGLTARYPGRIGTDSGGEGIEFHSTREYRASDPLARIDWYRFARTGELATLEYREERIARVMLVVDTRRAAYLAPSSNARHAVDRAVTAAHRIFVGLLESGNPVGVASFGPVERECWLAPGSGDAHRARGRDLLTSHAAFSQVPPDRDLFEWVSPGQRETAKRDRVDRLHRRLLPDTQVVLISPCCDRYVPMMTRQLEAYGRPVTVLSPDSTSSATGAETLAGIERAERIAALRERWIRVIDWARDELLVEALNRAGRRES